MKLVENSNKSSITSTINTGAGSSLHSVSTSPTLKPKKPVKQNDSKLAKNLSEQLKESLAFDEVRGDWYQYRNGVWREVSKFRASRKINNALHQFLPDGFNISKLSAVENFLKLYLLVDEWQTGKDFLPLKNGAYDLKNQILIPHSPDFNFTWQLPFAYEPGAKIDVIRRWLWQSTNQDLEAIRIVRAFFKAALVGDGVQKFLEIVGPGGTGKSTLVRLMQLLIGDKNLVATDLQNLERNRFETASFYGKKLIVISDSSRYGGEVSMLKALTGGDPIRYEEKNRQQGQSFVFSGVVVIASNEPIQSSDYTSGLARRRVPLRFSRKVTDEDKAQWQSVGGIENAMKAELPGLLNWVLAMPDDEYRAALNGINGELSQSERYHLIETNPLAAWIDDNLIADAESELFIGKLSDKSDGGDDEADSKLYPNYARWCDQNGRKPIGLQRFSGNLLDVCEHCRLNVTKLTRTSQGIRFKGISIRKPFDVKSLTPITRESLSPSAEQCRPSVGPVQAEGPENVDSVEDDGIIEVSDYEVF